MPKSSLNTQETVEMLHCVANAIIAAEPELTDADRNLGDGDHGLGMQRGMTAVIEKLTSSSIETVGQAFTTVGMAMMSSMGGASGAIFGTMFRSGGKAIENPHAFDAKGLSELLVAGNAGVMDRGGAKPGDKTLIDSLYPASLAAEQNSGSELHEALQEVAQAGETGRDKSSDLIATVGRAKTLGDKSIGFPDAGACSIAIMLRAMADFTSQ
ncbi:MAG: dihydroxyacetone kinase subunit L [Verrucomicrobiales bacterium]|nr:dihydroxyacetone kinase subunit L [Verrucomicrobiales bacterium]